MEQHREITLPEGVDDHMVPPDDDAEDQDLMLRIQRGDGAAFHRLGDKYRHKLPSMLPRTLRCALKSANDGLADVVQSFWLKVLKGAHTYVPGRPVRPWLSAVLQSSAIDYLNAQNSLWRRWRFGILDILNLAAPPELVDEAKRERWRAKIGAALLQFNEQDRRLIELHLRGVSDADIAAELGITPGACRVRRHRIIKKLRKLIDPEPE